MTDEKLKQFFKLADELYAEELQQTGLKCPPIYVEVENEYNFIVISPLFPDLIKKHLKNVLTEHRLGEKEYNKRKGNNNND